MLKNRRNRTLRPPEECSLTICVRYLSGAWTPNILWYLSSQPRRFTELKRDLQGISGKMLTQRLRRLQKHGLVTRGVMPTSPPSVEYSLTDLGRTLQPALAALVAVGHQIKLLSRRANANMDTIGVGEVRHEL